ncbi:MAG: DUF4214 domain-containing protein, partial [Thalassovita sp.]
IYGDGYQARYNPTEANQIFGLYQTAFGRDPDAAGYVDWTQQLASNALTLSSVAMGFANSREFFGEYGTLDNREFVEQLYQNALNRPGEAAGIASWEAILNSGGYRETVLLGFAQSPEFIANTTM